MCAFAWGWQMVGGLSPVNVSFFAEPQLTKQYRFARQGILNPSTEDLHPDRYAYLYRFGYSDKSDDENLSSPWWSDFQSFISIKLFAERNQISTRISSRIYNAQAPFFGPADTIYRAKLGAMVRAFRGVGRPIESFGRMYFPPSSVTQTFIPGLRDWPHKSLSALGKKVLVSYSKEEIGPGCISLNGE
jgi:hypothetical protein